MTLWSVQVIAVDGVSEDCILDLIFESYEHALKIFVEQVHALSPGEHCFLFNLSEDDPEYSFSVTFQNSTHVYTKRKIEYFIPLLPSQRGYFWMYDPKVNNYRLFDESEILQLYRQFHSDFHIET